MYIVHVHCHVKPEFVDVFRQACVENATHSVQEPGIARFDVVQDTAKPTHFVLCEVYRTPDDPPKHRETAHYKTWNETVAPWMADPRSKEVFGNIYPGDEGWG